jgi:hypothetical protein
MGGIAVIFRGIQNGLSENTRDIGRFGDKRMYNDVKMATGGRRPRIGRGFANPIGRGFANPRFCTALVSRYLRPSR